MAGVLRNDCRTLLFLGCRRFHEARFAVYRCSSCRNVRWIREPVMSNSLGTSCRMRLTHCAHAAQLLRHHQIRLNVREGS
jgi:hypothetical protein